MPVDAPKANWVDLMMKANAMKRSEFLKSLGAALALPSAGCRSWFMSAAHPMTPNYFCTWRTQGARLGAARKSGIARFPGDQGNPSTRDNLNEELLFGWDGWTGFYPESRGDLIFTIDDGWDVPYATDPQKKYSLFGSLVPDATRFPSLRGTPGERLRQLSDRVKDAGWRGLGLWVSPVDEPEDDVRRKLEYCAQGEIACLKVDWGNGADPRFRQRMYRLKQKIAPDILMEHCRVQMPLNGLDRQLRGNGRRLVGEVDKDVLNDERAILPYCDVWRIYDWYLPLVVPQSIERTVCDLKLVGETGSKAIVNTEDAIYVASALGCSFGVMRSRHTASGGHAVSDISKRLKEVDRATAWARIAPPFNGGTIRWSDKALSDSWYARKGEFWYAPVNERDVAQFAPAVASRNLPLPEVSAGSDAPYVLATRYPNGAIAVAALPRIRNERFFTPRADVRLDAVLEPGVPLGVFGRFGSLSLRMREGFRVLVADLAGGRRHDLTAACKIVNGVLTLPGDLLARIGTESGADESLPAVFVEAV